jgi:hypothetical protein
MADIRINDLPNEATPNPSEFLAIDGVSTRKSTIQLVVNAGAPVASQAQAEAGVDNNARMTALSTKQSINFNSVPLSRTVTAGSGLTGGGSLASNISIALSSTSLASLALADSAVQPSRQVVAGTGLSGGGSLSADVTLNLSSATQTSLGLADTAIQDGSNALIPNGGTTGQVLVKNSNTNRDTAWSTVAAATAVSYAAQSLNDSQQSQARSNISAPLKGHIFGLTMSNNAVDTTNDIDISAGEASSTETNPVLMVLLTGITKRLDATWSVGSGSGGRDTGSIADGTWHVFLIQRSDTGVVDVLFSLSATAPTMPANYDRKRRIGSIIRSGATILAFTQRGDHFDLSAFSIDRNSTAIVGSALLALTVPSGVVVEPKIALTQEQNAAGNIQTRVGSAGAQTASVMITKSAGEATTTSISSGVFTNTSSQIQFQVQSSGGSLSINVLTTTGWVDTRGRT